MGMASAPWPYLSDFSDFISTGLVPERIKEPPSKILVLWENKDVKRIDQPNNSVAT